MILAIETSTGLCSTALIERETVIAAREERIGRGHAERLVPMIEDLLDGAVPTAILVSTGPGSFTGIRVGIAAAQGLAIGWGIPLHGFSSLAAIAAAARSQRTRPDEAITAVLPAGHGELFLQAYSGRSLRPLGDALALRPEAAARVIDTPLLAGPATPLLADLHVEAASVTLDPLARYAALLPSALRSLAPAPIYVRPPDAKPSKAA